MQSFTDFVERLPAAWRIGVIIGGTGAGKTRAIEALRRRGIVAPRAPPTEWPERKAIVSAIFASPLVRAKAAEMDKEEAEEMEREAREQAAAAEEGSIAAFVAASKRADGAGAASADRL